VFSFSAGHAGIQSDEIVLKSLFKELTFLLTRERILRATIGFFEYMV